MDNTEHKSCNHQTEGDNNSANVPGVQGSGDYNKELSLLQLSVLCLWNRNKHKMNLRKFKMLNLAIKYIYVSEFFNVFINFFFS